MIKPVLFLMGPTGSGKTQLSVRLAKRLNCEIISADSMQIYRGMNIGTAKPGQGERRGIRHHLLDLVSPRSSYSVYQHRKQALQAVQEIHRWKRTPLIVGGSGLYLDAIWKGFSHHPGGDSKLRRQLMKEAGKKGLSFLYEKLRSIDPVRATKIHPHDGKRIVRALEIAEVSGRSPSEWYRKMDSLANSGFSVRVYGIQRERSDLYERINRRVVMMFRKGLVREVLRLKRGGFSKTAKQALGYREILECLNRGGSSPKQTPSLIPLIQKRTRHFAKRQLTWFRREKDIRWISWAKKEPCSAVCDKIVTDVKLWLKNKPCL